MVFGVIGVLFLAGIAAAVVAVVSYFLLLPVQLMTRPKGPNRYGPVSSTRDIASAIAGGFRRAFDFSGRANLLDFWAFTAAVGALCFAAVGAAFFLGLFAIAWRGEGSPWVLTPLAIVPGLAVPSLSMAVRRLHDVNRSGWWLMALGIGGILTLLHWFVQPSQSDAQDKAEVFA